MLYKFHTSSKNTWEAMFKAISQAQKSVYLEMYIFENDMPEYDFKGQPKSTTRRHNQIIDEMSVIS